MEKFVDCDRRKGYGPEVVHDVAHLPGVEFHSYRILHPCVRDENPQGRDACAKGGEPCRGEMEAGADFFPSEEHNCYECCFHEEGQESLDGEGGSEDVAYKPAVV